MEWLRKQLETYGLGPLGIIFAFIFGYTVLITAVSVAGDMGFSDEISRYRWLIIIGGAFVAAFVATIWWAARNRREYVAEQQKSKQSQQELAVFSEKNRFSIL